MNVKELIKKLEAFDTEQDVCITLDGSEGAGMFDIDPQPTECGCEDGNGNPFTEIVIGLYRLKPASNLRKRGPRIRITREGKNMNFGQALEVLRAGKRIARAGWNGKGMWLWLVQKDEYRLTSRLSPENLPVAEALEAGTMLPWIMMCTAQCDFVPWLASQTDMLSGDWEVLK